VCQCSGVSDQETNPAAAGDALAAESARDLAALSAVEILGAHIVDLMTAAAVKTGLYEGGERDRDLAEARILIDALAGLIDGAAPHLGGQHAAPLKDGLQSLQAAFAEFSPAPDPPGQGPGERFSRPRRRR
jgi:hypothetical protein